MARELAKQAIEIDPKFTSAYAQLAFTYYNAARSFFEPKEEALDAALANANKAMELDDGSAYAHAALAAIYDGRGDTRRGLEFAEKAANLSPNDFVAQAVLGLNLSRAGRFEEAVPYLKLAMRLAPNYPAWIPSALGDAHLALGDFASAEEAIKKKLARENTPESVWEAHAKLALVYAQTNRERDADQAVSRARELHPSGSIALARATNSFRHNPDVFDAWVRIWRRLGVPEVPGMQAFRPQDRLTGEELRALRSSSPWAYGVDPQKGVEYWSFTNPQSEIEVAGIWTGVGNQIRGNEYIEDDLLCANYSGLGKYCVAYYRNPGGTRKNNDEYVVVSGVGAFPVSVYKHRPPALAGKLRNVPETAPLPLADKPSIAVLPFDNLSNNPEQDYFADGMADTLLTDLSGLSGLFVIARNSSFAYKGKSVDVRQVGRELGVKFVLEGSVLRVGDQVRINAQLIDTATGGHVWADRYDGSMKDVFALQDKVIRAIVEELAITLNVAEEEGLAQPETQIVAAYDAFLQGWDRYLRQTQEDNAKAVTFFEKALEFDPDYARSYAALALAQMAAVFNQWHKALYVECTGLMNQRMGCVNTVATMAVLNLEEAKSRPPTPLYHLAVSIWQTSQKNHADAVLHAEQAVALDPNDPSLLSNLSWVLTGAAQHRAEGHGRGLPGDAGALGPGERYRDTHG